MGADNPVFESGNFKLVGRQNRGILLVERATHVRIPVRKLAAPLKVKRDEMTGEPQVPVQCDLFESDSAEPIGLEALADGLQPALVWAVDKYDGLADFLAVVVRRIESLGRSPLQVRAVASVPPLEHVLHTPGHIPAQATPIDDDFESVAKRHRRDEGVEGQGGTSSRA